MPGAIEAGRNALGAVSEEYPKATDLDEIGTTQVTAGDLSAARNSFEESYELRRRLAAVNPTSAQEQRDLWMSLWRLASLPNSQVRWAEVARVIRGMRERGLLEPRDLPNLAEAERRARQEPIKVYR